MTPVDMPPENVTNMQLYAMLRDIRHLQVRQAERVDAFVMDFDKHRKEVEPMLQWFGAAKVGAKVMVFLAAIGVPAGVVLGWFAGDR